MKDLLLFRLLRAPELDPSALVPLLGELAALPLGERLPFLGLLRRPLAHADPGLRAAALGALAGADGRLAFLHEVAALDDADAGVRLAAVTALRASDASHGGRLAHALYHPTPDVRRAAIDGRWTPGGAAYAFPLLADPETAPELLRRLEEKTPPEDRPPPALTAEGLSALFELTARGSIPRPLAIRLVADVAWDDLQRWLGASTQRGPDAVAAALERAAAGPPADGHADAFEAVLALLWDGDEAARERFFRRLSAEMRGFSLDLRLRAVAALLVRFGAQGTFPPGAAGIAALYHPPFLAWAWVPRDVRRAAVGALYRAGGQAPRLGEDEVRALLAADLCRRPDGTLDLWVVGGLLCFCEQHPYLHLLRWVDERAVIEGFLADVDGSIPFLSHRDDSNRGRDYLVDRLAQAGGLDRALVRALLIVAAPLDRLDFLERADPEEAAALTLALLRVLRRTDGDLPTKKVAGLGPLLGKLALRPDLAGSALVAWLEGEAPGNLAFGLGVLGALGVAMTAPAFVALAQTLPAPVLRTLLAALPACTVFPYGKELALAQELAAHPDEVVQAWARERAPAPPEALPVVRVVVDPSVRALTAPEIERIVAASEVDLRAAVAACLAGPTTGLTGALARRPAPSAPILTVCVALLGSHDPLEEVDAQIGRFGADDEPFLSALDAEAVRVWERETLLPPLGHALVYRWERHALALAEGFAASEGLGPWLARAAALTQAALRQSVWEAVASALAMWRWRDRPKLGAAATGELLGRLVAALDTDVGEAAAAMLATVFDARAAPELIEEQRPAIERALPDLTPKVRARLSALVDTRGLAGSGVVRAAGPAPVDGDLAARIARSRDLEELAAFCRSPIVAVAEEAALRLVELGEAGCARVLAAIVARAPARRPLLDSLALWPEGPSLRGARALADDVAEAPELRFRLAVALAQRGERAFVERALEAARVEASEPWFGVADWAALRALGQGELGLSIALAGAPHPHAYRTALAFLLAVPARDVTEAMAAAVASFLEAGTTRLGSLRYHAALWLQRRGDARGFPILLAGRQTQPEPALLAGAAPDLVDAAIDAVLVGGTRAGGEQLAVDLLEDAGVDPDELVRSAARLLVDASSAPARTWAVGRIRGQRRGEKLRALAETFAWGIRTGRALTGRLFKVEMTTGQDLGYTRLNESRVFVSPLPILRGAAHGRAIVKGLILHELGHHLYHRGDAEEAAWKAAEKEGIFGLLNTLADEHLERNLRAGDASHGDRLKRLGAHAFQHASKDVPVAALLSALGGRAFEVLTATRLEVAREPRSVRVGSGALLLHMERAGLSFSRFFRALRLGLGDRHDDRRVREALDLCKGIRKRTLPELLDLARRLRALFGWETSLVESVGPHETVERGAAEGEIFGEGITQEELEREIERIIDPERRRPGAAGGPGGRTAINVSPDESFDPIRAVTKIPHDPAAHARYAAQIGLAARQMRRYLDALGVTLEPERRRLRGHRFDPGRAVAVVTRGDPRMLVAREPRIRTDLFLGVLVDCSGSMATRDNIEKARLFGAMLAEAARGARGVELRIFGFNDTTMYDAGDASRCAAHGLSVGGGNNDAGALFHLAQVARASRRRAKLLVMISDGLPTECSVAALRALVQKLGARHGMCCAQVAVQPLAEVCFPHYVVLAEADPAPAVRRFGEIVARLVARALGR